MKNKKGFTLVELLAVIAILAILVIMALPAVLRMYRQARQNSFENEVKTIFKAAKDKYLERQMDPSTELLHGQTVIYSNVSALGTVTLDVSNGSGDFKYCVKVDNNGDVKQLMVSNGTYVYKKTTDIADASAITSADVSEDGNAVGSGSDNTYKCN